MADSAAFTFVCTTLEESTALDKLEARGTIRLALKEAGLDGENAPGKAIRKRFKDVKFFAGSKYSVAGLKRLGAAVRKGSWLMSSEKSTTLECVPMPLPPMATWPRTSLAPPTSNSADTVGLPASAALTSASPGRPVAYTNALNAAPSAGSSTG